MDAATIRRVWRNDGTQTIDDLNGFLFSGENGAHTFVISGVDASGQAVALSGTVTGQMILSDGTTVPMNGEISDGKAVLSLIEACYLVPGAFRLSIFVSSTGTAVCVYAAVGTISRTATSAVIDPEDIIPDLETLQTAAGAAQAAAEDAAAAALAGVRTDTASQGLSDTQKANARTNIGAAGINETFAGVTANATKITTAGDFHDYTTPGNWYIDNSSVMGNMTNKPNSSVGGRLFVFQNIASGRIVHLWLTSAATPRLYIEYYNGTSWSDWTLFALETDIPALDTGLDTIGEAADAKATGDAIAAAKAAVMEYLYEYNATDALELGGGTSGTSHEVSFTRNADSSWTINGTASGGDAIRNITGGQTLVPDGIVPGRRYYLDFHGGTIPIRVYIYKSGTSSFTNYSENSWIEMPSDMIGIIIRYQIDSGTTVSNATVKYTLIPEPVVGAGEVQQNVYNITNNENTYNVTATPTITTDTNNYLAASGDSTDRTNDIATMLSATGVCNLGPGTFVVYNLQMPEGTMIRGSGPSTVLKLSADATNTCYCIKPGDYCVIRDLKLLGADSDITISTDTAPANRHGIYYQGVYNSGGSSTNGPKYINIDNVYIRNFTGGGITCYDTGIDTGTCIHVVNARINHCKAGINIAYQSEFNRFTSCQVHDCHWGLINNGGNNVFSNCNFSSNYVCILMDNERNQSPNNTHGSMIGCTVNHAWPSNTGTAIEIINCESGFIFSGCQFWYGYINLTDAPGIVFNGCEFGAERAITITNTGSGGILTHFASCLFKQAPTVTESGTLTTVFTNCYLRDGTAVT